MVYVQETVSVLYREPKLLKALVSATDDVPVAPVSVLYREPKLLKAGGADPAWPTAARRFSALP